MAKLKIQGNASGTGVITLIAPNTNTDRTVTLPDESITLAGGGDLSFGGDTFGANKTIGSNDNYALSFETNATERLQLTNDGRGLSQFTAKAWVSFSGSANTIYDQHNVSSVVDNATGQFTVNFAYSMANNAYTVVSSAEASNNVVSIYNTTSSSYKMYCHDADSSVAQDNGRAATIVFGD